MIRIMSLLEPIKYQKNEIIFQELDEYSEVIFILNAYFKIGYSINRQQFFKIKKKNIPIGAYGVTYVKKSYYIYKTISDC